MLHGIYLSTLMFLHTLINALRTSARGVTGVNTTLHMRETQTFVNKLVPLINSGRRKNGNL